MTQVRTHRILTACATAAVVASALAGCIQPTSIPPKTTATAYPSLVSQIDEVESIPTPASQATLAEQALAVLDTIDVAKKTEWDGPFDRIGSFGDGWGDLDGDGCNTRQEVLKDSLDVVRMHGDGCRVNSGVLEDPYTGESIPFQRGAATSEEVQIDHVVALYNAWRTGAQDLTFEERVTFANDPLNLQATAGWANDDKESKDASQWLPPNVAYRCTYVARQIAIKATYDLWVTQAEDDAMREVLANCE